MTFRGILESLKDEEDHLHHLHHTAAQVGHVFGDFLVRDLNPRSLSSGSGAAPPELSG